MPCQCSCWAWGRGWLRSTTNASAWAVSEARRRETLQRESLASLRQNSSQPGLRACLLPGATAFRTDIPSLRAGVSWLELGESVALVRAACSTWGSATLWDAVGPTIARTSLTTTMSGACLLWIRQLPWCAGARGGAGHLPGFLGKPCLGIVVFRVTYGTSRMYGALRFAAQWSWAHFTCCPLVCGGDTKASVTSEAGRSWREPCLCSGHLHVGVAQEHGCT